MTTIIGLVGEAGAGKDTLAKFLVENRNGCIVAHADPLKRYIHKVFGASVEALWGASSERANVIPGLNNPEGWWEAGQRAFYFRFARDWLKELGVTGGAHWDKLKSWQDTLQKNNPKSISTRTICQALGTEFARNLSPNIWSDFVLNTAKKLLVGGYTYHKETGPLRSGYSGYDFVVTPDVRFRNEAVGILQSGGELIRIDAGARVDYDIGGIPNHASEVESKTIPECWLSYTVDNSLGCDLADLREWARSFAVEKNL